MNIVARQRTCLFGDVADGEIRLNHIGKIVADTWKWLEEQYPHVMLDEYVVMPDHLHGIIVIHDNGSRGVWRNAPTPGADINQAKRKPLGQLIGAFKTVTTKQFNMQSGTAGPTLWQRNYWERVIRDGRELDRIREYIRNNPFQWKPSS